MIEIGRLCLKTAGRDAGGKCAIVEIIDDNYVMIDGNVRRRKCNIGHLEPLAEVIKIKNGASHDDIKREFEKLGLEIWKTKKKGKTEKPKRKRKTPEELKAQKEEKKKSKGIFKKKEKKEEAKADILEEKAAA